MVNIFFGLEFDEHVIRPEKEMNINDAFLGQKKIVYYLEQIIGLEGISNNNEFIRIEQYRQILDFHVGKVDQDLFFLQSFKVDALATSAALLKKRDELILSGWSFEMNPDLPDRLSVLAQLESIIQNDSIDYHLDLGYADRFKMILEWIPAIDFKINSISVNEPRDLRLAHFAKLFDALEAKGIKIVYRSSFDSPKGKTDLENWQLALLGEPYDRTLKGDGSLLLLHSKRDFNAVNWLSKFWSNNPGFVDSALLSFKSPILDIALMKEGLPALGVLSTSDVRPTLQILKLVTSFFWRPIDPYKMLEFVSLVVKPLYFKLGWAIAKALASSPGMFGPDWNAAIGKFFGDLEEDPNVISKEVDIDTIRFQYNFWFKRKRVHINQQIPKHDVKEVFDYLSNWARQEFESKSENNALLVVSEQAKRMVELLDTLPEEKQGISFLELEQMVQVIYESAPVVLYDAEVGHTPFTYQNSGFTIESKKLLWWGFGDVEQDYFFPNWYNNELAFFEKAGISVTTPVDENKLKLWQRIFPVLNTKEKLVLVELEKIDGQEMQNHPLLSDLKASFDNWESVYVDIDSNEALPILEKEYQIPNWISMLPHRFENTEHTLYIDEKYELAEAEKHSFTSLDSLLYYPHTWLLRSKCKLYPVSILSIHSEARLMGNLSHRFFELLLKENDVSGWTQKDVFKWVDEHELDILSKEGAVLLMYGREPDKEAFLNRVKIGAWSFVKILQSNNWSVQATESKLEGTIDGVPLKGIADLVLEREGEIAIIDFKWKGKNWRLDLINNEEDLQLAMYLSMHPSEGVKHSGYYIISDSVVVARNQYGFSEAVCKTMVEDQLEVHERILEKIRKTYDWRKKQLENGQLEIRLERNIRDLDEAYIEESLDLLEMKRKDGPFDDYRVLIGDLL